MKETQITMEKSNDSDKSHIDESPSRQFQISRQQQQQQQLYSSSLTSSPVLQHRKEIQLTGDPPWGFRMCGGRDTNLPLRIARVNPGSKAARGGIREGDEVTAINGYEVTNLTNGEAQRLLKKTGPSVKLELKSAKRMNVFEGSAITTGELESSAGVVVASPVSTTNGDNNSTVETKDTGPGSSLSTTTSTPSIGADKCEDKTLGGSLKKKKSPSQNSGSGKSSKSSGKKKTVEFKERSVDEPVQKISEDTVNNKDTTDSHGTWSPHLNNNNNNNNNNTVSSPVNHQQGLTKPLRKHSEGDLTESSSVPALTNASSSDPLPPIWTPPTAPSPSTQKKFRPVNFNVPGSPTNSSPRIVSLERSVSAGAVGELPLRALPTESHNIESSVDRVDGDGSVYQNHHHYLHQSQSSPTVHLPKYQSPTVTLLQKAREGHLPKGASYLDHKLSGVKRSSSATENFNSLQQNQHQQHPQQQQHPITGSSQQPSLNPNESLFELKREEYTRHPSGATSRRVDFSPKRYDGIGPTTVDGVPIALKTGTNGHEWYKRMYESLHVDNKQHRKGAPIKSSYGGGSWSEPEGYESDYPKYVTLDRRKVRDRYLSETEYLSGQQTACIPGSIRFTPGRIEDYTPGKSSVAAKAIHRHKPTLGWALGSKELAGYESDSTLVIRKRQESQDNNIPSPPPLSPAEQRHAYVEIQKGGEVPLHGLRKLAPEKPKAMSPMPTLEDVRRSLAHRPRSGSPSSFRSGSPSILKSSTSTVALLQERIQAKLRRANSDINPSQIHGRRSKSSPSGAHAASRLIHSVRSTSISQVTAASLSHSHYRSPSSSSSSYRGAGPSFIPVRSRNPSIEKLRVSSPELTSPKEVKKAIETSHRLAIKLEVVKVVPSGSGSGSGSTSTKTTTTTAGTGGSSPKKSKHSSSDEKEKEKKSGSKKSGGGKNGKSKSKSVKISENVSVVLNGSHSSGGSGSNTPAKPPRKLNGKNHDGSSKMDVQSSTTSTSTNGSNGTLKVHKTVKATPVASRHASCLSPHQSRPTSPGGAPSTSTSSNVQSTSSYIPVPPKIPPSSSFSSSSSGNGSKSDKKKSPATSTTASSSSTTTSTSTTTTPTSGSKISSSSQSRSHRSPGDGHEKESVTSIHTSKTNRISRSAAAKVSSFLAAAFSSSSSSPTPPTTTTSDQQQKQQQQQQESSTSTRKGKSSKSSSVEKEQQQLSSTDKTSMKISSSNTPGVATTTSSSISGGNGSNGNSKRVREESEGSTSKIKSSKMSASGVTTASSLSSLLPVPTSMSSLVMSPSSSPLGRSSSSYLTIPPRKLGREYLMDVWTLTEERDIVRSTSPHFRSLPALTPYLKETKRVSGSTFVLKTNHAAMLREKAALAKRLGLDEQQSLYLQGQRGLRGGPTSKSNGKGGSPKKVKAESGAARLQQQQQQQTTTTTTIQEHTSRSKLRKGTATSTSTTTMNTLTTTTSSNAVVRSASCLGLRRSRDYTYARYILELQHSRKKSPRFVQLHRLYSSLERLGQLERSTSMYDIPILSSERQLDFDTWWKVRNRIRVDEEIASISSQLSAAQKNRDFFISGRRLDEFKWKGDSALRCKQWTIDELRSFLQGEYDGGLGLGYGSGTGIGSGAGSGTGFGFGILSSTSGKLQGKSVHDLHKTAWRGQSVKQQALNMQLTALTKGDSALAKENARIYNGPWLRRAFSMSSTLSEDQRENIKARLGSLIRPGGRETDRVDKERVGRPTERRVVTSRMGMTLSSDPLSPKLYRTDSGRIIGADGYLTEAAKKQLSRSLSHEFREKKIQEKKSRQSTESESNKSDDSVRTVIHVPISTKVLLNKMEKKKDEEKSKTPAYSVYCSKGVPSKVNFFENYYQQSDRQQPASLSCIMGSSKSMTETGGGTGTGSGRGRKLIGSSRIASSSISPVRAGSPSSSAYMKRSRSASPHGTATTTGSKIGKPPLSYVSHVNVISRLASLLLKRDDALQKLVQRELIEREKLERLRLVNAGEVDRLKYYFETHDCNDDYGKEMDLLRCLFCSDPNLARMTEWRSDHCDRRCASADIFKEKLIDNQQQQLQCEKHQNQNQNQTQTHSKNQQMQLDRDRKPDGRESSPVNCSSPDLYLNSRSRKPIYQPSSTPNVCQPTLTAHCFLESPNKSLEYLNQQAQQQGTTSSCYSSDYSGGFWDFYSATESVSIGTASPSPPYHSISIPPAPPRVLDSRISNASGISLSGPGPGVGSSGERDTGVRNWNVDPALHMVKFRYVPPQPRINISSSSSSPLIPPPLPPPPNMQNLNMQSSSAENRFYNPYLYRSVRYWNPRTRSTSREYVGGQIQPPNRNSHQNQTSQNHGAHLSSPMTPPPKSPQTQYVNNKSGLVRRMVSQDDDVFDEVDHGKIENQKSLVENQNELDRNELQSPAPPLPASPVRYAESEVNIHYKAPIRLVEKDYIGEEELRRRQEIVMRRFYEEQRHRKFLAEIQDMENRRHTDNFTPSQKSPIPLNRYEDMNDEPQRPRWREKTPDQRIVAKALYNFVPQNSRELSFRKGDILYIHRKIDSNWYEGEHNAAVGIFPTSYVQIIPSYEIDRATPRIPSEGQARVRFNFTAASPVEMSIIKGETVVLTRRVDANWYEGRIGSRRGIFPCSYVQVMKEPGMDLTAALSPKPTGSPAAHSLAAHQIQNFRHNYKPNDYYSPSSVSIPSFSDRENYGAGGRVSQSSMREQSPSRTLYSQNLTIDTREPMSYKALYNYKPAHDDELELRENDVIHVLEKCDDNWFVGTNINTGDFGTFPGNYVMPL